MKTSSTQNRYRYRRQDTTEQQLAFTHVLRSESSPESFHNQMPKLYATLQRLRTSTQWIYIPHPATTPTRPSPTRLRCVRQEETNSMLYFQCRSKGKVVKARFSQPYVNAMQHLLLTVSICILSIQSHRLNNYRSKCAKNAHISLTYDRLRRTALCPSFSYCLHSLSGCLPLPESHFPSDCHRLLGNYPRHYAHQGSNWLLHWLLHS
jgi:hypothetical protein